MTEVGEKRHGGDSATGFIFINIDEKRKINQKQPLINETKDCISIINYPPLTENETYNHLI